jgi:hypothetical protein
MKNLKLYETVRLERMLGERAHNKDGKRVFKDTVNWNDISWKEMIAEVEGIQERILNATVRNDYRLI